MTASTTDEVLESVFRKGSTTYYNSSRFFPRSARREVFILYAFVRVADDFVDNVPQQAEEFRQYVAHYRKAKAGEPSGNPIIDLFVQLEAEKGFAEGWMDAFLHSMELDLTKQVYSTTAETLEYVYGSAEVIGLAMSRIMGLPDEAHHAARMLGRAMQYINFIRDIEEDQSLGRTYLPLADTSLAALDEQTALTEPEEFRRFIRVQVERYLGWQREASEGYRFIPRRYLIPIRTAAEMYAWTAREIARDPFVVYRRNVKPRRGRILRAALLNLVFPRRKARFHD